MGSGTVGSFEMEGLESFGALEASLEGLETSLTLETVVGGLEALIADFEAEAADCWDRHTFLTGVEGWETWGGEGTTGLDLATDLVWGFREGSSKHADLPSFCGRVLWVSDREGRIVAAVVFTPWGGFAGVVC